MKNINKNSINKDRLIIAFGSQVTGHTNAMSDFDFAILEKKPLTLSKKISLIDYLVKKLKINEDKIDLVDLNTASPLLNYEVAQKGELVEGSDFDFIRFKVRAWKIYLDTAKFRLIDEQMLQNYVKGFYFKKT